MTPFQVNVHYPPSFINCKTVYLISEGYSIVPLVTHVVKLDWIIIKQRFKQTTPSGAPTSEPTQPRDGCPENVLTVTCISDPCLTAKCDNNPDARCIKVDKCGECTTRFYDVTGAMILDCYASNISHTGRWNSIKYFKIVNLTEVVFSWLVNVIFNCSRYRVIIFVSITELLLYSKKYVIVNIIIIIISGGHWLINSDARAWWEINTEHCPPNTSTTPLVLKGAS